MSQQFHALSESDSSSSDIEPADIIVPTSSNSISTSFPKAPNKNKVNSKNDKAERLKIKEKFKYLSPSSCLNYISMSCEESILSNSVFNGVLVELGKTQVPIKIHEGHSGSIIWIRKQLSGDCLEEPHTLLLWDHITFLHFIQTCQVNKFFEDVKKSKPNNSIYFVIYGLLDFCRRKRKKGKLSEREVGINSIPSRDVIENLLCEMQLTFGISHRLFDNQMELVNFIIHLTKSIAEEPYRKQKEIIEMEKTSYLQGNSRSCVKIDKQNNGMQRLWIQQLAEIPMSSLDYAKAIASLYSSPFALYQAYNVIKTIEEREQMLQNIAIGREGSKKRLGPEMSKRIFHLFSS